MKIVRLCDWCVEEGIDPPFVVEYEGEDPAGGRDEMNEHVKDVHPNV